MAEASVAPGSNAIERIFSMPEFENSIVVKQTRKGCFQQCLGCDPNQEFKITTEAKHEAKDKEHLFYAVEKTNCCLRFICGGMRPYTIDMHEGPTKESPVFMSVKRPFAMSMGRGLMSPAFLCEYCCPQKVEFLDGEKKKFGKAQMDPCYCCNPSMTIYDEAGKAEFTVTQDICGHLMQCKCKRIDFDIRKAGSKDITGTTSKLWGGWGKEIFTDADTFLSKWEAMAADLTPAQKARIAGTTFLINQMFFERDSGNA